MKDLRDVFVFICGAVEAASESSCDVAGHRAAALVSGQSGYLSGVWAAETGCGTVDWRLRRYKSPSSAVMQYINDVIKEVKAYCQIHRQKYTLANVLSNGEILRKTCQVNTRCLLTAYCELM